jgi:hypothetical protein
MPDGKLTEHEKELDATEGQSNKPGWTTEEMKRIKSQFKQNDIFIYKRYLYFFWVELAYLLTQIRDNCRDNVHTNELKRKIRHQVVTPPEIIKRRIRKCVRMMKNTYNLTIV